MSSCEGFQQAVQRGCGAAAANRRASFKVQFPPLSESPGNPRVTGHCVAGAAERSPLFIRTSGSTFAAALASEIRPGHADSGEAVGPAAEGSVAAFRTSPIPARRLQETRVRCAARYNNAVSPEMPARRCPPGDAAEMPPYLRLRSIARPLSA